MNIQEFDSLVEARFNSFKSVEGAHIIHAENACFSELQRSDISVELVFQLVERALSRHPERVYPVNLRDIDWQFVVDNMPTNRVSALHVWDWVIVNAVEEPLKTQCLVIAGLKRREK
jgi:hypothetical protein